MIFPFYFNNNNNCTNIIVIFINKRIDTANLLKI